MPFITIFTIINYFIVMIISLMNHIECTPNCNVIIIFIKDDRVNFEHYLTLQNIYFRIEPSIYSLSRIVAQCNYRNDMLLYKF